jgi:hypothetical protein
VGLAPTAGRRVSREPSCARRRLSRSMKPSRWMLMSLALLMAAGSQTGGASTAPSLVLDPSTECSWTTCLPDVCPPAPEPVCIGACQYPEMLCQAGGCPSLPALYCQGPCHELPPVFCDGSLCAPLPNGDCDIHLCGSFPTGVCDVTPCDALRDGCPPLSCLLGSHLICVLVSEADGLIHAPATQTCPPTPTWICNGTTPPDGDGPVG